MILREYRMKFERVPEGEIAVDPEELGVRSKLGGIPDWVQDEEWPICDSCKQIMSFIAQIDSIEHESEKNPHSIRALSGQQHYMFADVGMIYVFVCFDCNESKNIYQFY